MAELRNYDAENNKGTLKLADSHKSDSFDGIKAERGSAEQLLQSMNEFSSIANSRKKRKKNLPLLTDIVIGLIVLTIVIGLAVGSYYLMRYYSNDYENISIEYTFLAPCEGNLSVYRTMKNEDLYLDTEDNTYYFGKVKNVAVYKPEDKNDPNNKLVLTVRINAKYKSDEGYSSGDNKIAVGSKYTLRCESTIVSGVIVELKQENLSGGEQ